MAAVEVYIDNTPIDVPTGGIYALTGSVTRRLNRPAEATITVPMMFAQGGAGSRLKVVINDELWFHGFILSCETDTGEDQGTTVYNATDPMELWQWRPVRDFDGRTPGNFVDPYILKDNLTGPQTVLAMCRASENPALISTVNGSFAEGPLFLAFNEADFETNGEDLSGAPVTWPTTMMELANMLTSTGELDIVITPIDSGGNMGQLSCYNGDYGTDRSGEVVFQYGFGLRNVRQLRWAQDLSNVANKIQYFYGPKETTRRYKSNTTGDDPCLPVQLGAARVNNLLARRLVSRSAYGVRMEIQEYDVDTLAKEQEPEGVCVALDPFKILYRRLWYLESWIRCTPRDIAHVTPIRETEIGTFDIGDLVYVACTPDVRGGFQKKQRVYGYTVAWDNDGVLELSELQTSSDQEGA